MHLAILLALLLLLFVIKILQSRLVKPVTQQIHTKLSLVPVVPVSSKPVSHKQLRVSFILRRSLDFETHHSNTLLNFNN